MSRNNKINLNNFQACLLGGAVGDALGAPLEFMHGMYLDNDVEKITKYIEYGNGQGRFTDDTQMTLFTAEALIINKYETQESPTHIPLQGTMHKSYLRWLTTQGPASPVKQTSLSQNPIMQHERAPGITCIKALHEGTMGTIEHPINDRKGCGGIMRVAPVGLAYAEDPEKAFSLAASAAAITHSHPVGFLTAGCLGAIIAELAQGKNLKNAIDTAMDILHSYDKNRGTLKAITDALDLYDDTTHDFTIEEYQTLGEGWIAEETLALSLFASLHHEHNFKQGVIDSVNHKGDSDSTGSVTGNILGIINGLDEIPLEYITNLEGADLIADISTDLYNAYHEPFNNKDTFWEKYIE